MSTQGHTRPLLAAGALAAAIALAGCGSGSSTAPSSQTPASTPASQPSTQVSASQHTQSATTPAKTARKRAQVKGLVPRIEKVEVSSPAVTGGLLAAQYTCDGSDVSPPLHIAGIPPGTAELMYVVLNLLPVKGELFFDWAVTAISPKQRTIAAGQVPPGAVVGANSNGQSRYALCPPTSESTRYVGVLFALRHHLPAKTGFDASTLRAQAIHDAGYEGFLPFAYQRK